MLTSRELVKIARNKADKEYSDYADIQSDMIDSCNRVNDACSAIKPAMDVLFADANRVDGWRRLVNATSAIASQTSRMLLTVFGAEQRRLVAAGLALLDTCAVNKSFGLMIEQDIASRGAELVNTTNKNSSQLMVFTAYVQARSRETEGAKQQQLKSAVDKFGKLNEQIVDGCNGICRQVSKESRDAFIRAIGETEVLTRAILDLITPTEDSDVFRLVQSLQGQRATVGVMTNRETPLGRAGAKLKQELIPLMKNDLGLVLIFTCFLFYMFRLNF